MGCRVRTHVTRPGRVSFARRIQQTLHDSSAQAHVLNPGHGPVRLRHDGFYVVQEAGRDRLGGFSAHADLERLPITELLVWLLG